MNEKCDHGYFVGKDWKIVQVFGDVEEEEGHVIRISGSAADLTIACQSDPVRHPPYKGRHNPERGCIEPLDGPGPVIVCAPGRGTRKDQISFQTGLAPGSWTAEDNGGTSGGGEG